MTIADAVITLDAHVVLPAMPEADSAAVDDVSELNIGVPFSLALDVRSTAADIREYIPDATLLSVPRQRQVASQQHQAPRAAQRPAAKDAAKEGADAAVQHDEDDDDDYDDPVDDFSDNEAPVSDNDDETPFVDDSDLMAMGAPKPRTKSKDESQRRAGCWLTLLPAIQDVQLKTHGAHKFECECCSVADGSLTEVTGLWRCSDCRISHMCTKCHHTVHVARNNGGVFHRYSRWNWGEQAWESDAASLGSLRVLAPTFFHVSGCNDACHLRSTDVQIIQLGATCTLAHCANCLFHFA